MAVSRAQRQSRKEVQARVVDGIFALTKERGYPPSYRELAAYVQTAHSNVWYAIEQLRKSGLVHDRKNSGVARVLVLTRAGVRAARDIGHPGVPSPVTTIQEYLDSDG